MLETPRDTIPHPAPGEGASTETSREVPGGPWGAPGARETITLALRSLEFGRPRHLRVRKNVASGPAKGASQQAVFGGGVVWKGRWGRTRGVKHTRGAGHPNLEMLEHFIKNHEDMFFVMFFF